MLESLTKSKPFQVVIIFIYYLAVVLPHNEVGAFINNSFDQISRPTYNRSIGVITVIAVIVFLLSARSKLRTHVAKRQLIYYLIFSLILILLSFNILFVINIEAVHFIQYGILSILLFSIINDFRSIMAICFLAGSLDEFYQYMILESTAFYYDFNDVLLDVIGAGIGLLILKIWGAKTTYSKTIWYKSYQWMIPITLSVTLIIMWLLGLFAVNNNFADPAWFTLFKRPPVEGFWFEPMGAHKRFHILTPIPGIVCIFIVCYIYGNLVKLSPKLETQ